MRNVKFTAVLPSAIRPDYSAIPGNNERNASEVTFELKKCGKSVLLVVTHRRLGDPEKTVSVASGWHTHLGILTDHLSGFELRPFWAAKARMQEEYGKRLAT